MNVHPWIAVFLGPDGRWRAVNDDQKRLICASHEAVGLAFCAALADRAQTAIRPVQLDPIRVTELIMSAYVKAENVAAHYIFIEEGEDTPEHWMARAMTMADAVPLDTPGDWWASRPSRALA